MKNKLNKTKLAQIIIMELHALKDYPCVNDPRVVKRARLSREVLDNQYDMAIRAKESRQ